MGLGADFKKALFEPVKFEAPEYPAPKMTRCKACGAEISALADACPKCGHPSAAKQIQGVGAILIVVGLLTIAYFLFVK